LPKQAKGNKLGSGSKPNSLALEGTPFDMVDPRFNKMKIKLSLDWRVSMTEQELNTILVRELSMYTRKNQDKRTNGLGY
jgi:hypothetical protein